MNKAGRTPHVQDLWVQYTVQTQICELKCEAAEAVWMTILGMFETVRHETAYVFSHPK